MMSKVYHILPEAGIYRDDGLAVTEMSGPEMTRAEKKLRKLFSDHGLKITTLVGATETDFLDVVFNLVSGKYRPFRKPGDEPVYINVKSNHPPSVIKALPGMIENRLSGISSSVNEFNGGKDCYERALKDAGYDKCGLHTRKSGRRGIEGRGHGK